MEPAHVRIELDITEYIQKQVFFNGGYEKDSVKKLNELLPQGGVFFDLGANIGMYSLNLCRKAKAVFAFEATKRTYDKLNKTIEGNGIKNIHLSFNAVDDKDDKEVSIFFGDGASGTENNGANSMHKGREEANKVRTIRLDTYIEREGISNIDIIKIDIEGNELYALRGGIESIKKFRPIIFCEINPRLNVQAGYSAKELWDFIIKELRYEARVLSWNHFRKISRSKATSGENVFFFPV
jgi:FkbM family methyltransferase